MVLGVAPVQTPTNANTITDAVNKLHMEAVEAAEDGRAPTPQATRKYSPGLLVGTVLWEEPHGAMGIGVHDEFRGGGARGGADTRVKAGIDIWCTGNASLTKTSMSQRMEKVQNRK
jgi:hypothetical protein